MGDKQSKLAGAVTGKKQGNISKEEYQAMLKAEQERMLTISSAPEQQRPPSDLLTRLQRLESTEPPPVKSQGQKVGSGEGQGPVEDFTSLLASFQVATREQNAALLNGTYSIMQGMRDTKILLDAIEKRVQQSNQQLVKLQADLTGVSKLERSIESMATHAARCASLVDSLNAILLENQAAIRRGKKLRQSSRGTLLSNSPETSPVSAVKLEEHRP